MNKTLTNLIMFAAGAVIGSVATWKLVKTKYEMKADQEIESMKEYYNNKELKVEKDSITKVADSIEKCRKSADKAVEAYKNYAQKYMSQQLIKPETRLEEEDEEEEMTKPYIITPEEFADSEYSVESLTYYTDGVIENDYGETWSDDEIEFLIGSDFAEHFGEYEQDSVYVRNEYKEIDYEILRDTRSYSESHK